MRMIALPLLATLMAGSALADDAPLFAAGDIVDAATGDWNRDGHQDLAIIAVTDREANDMGVFVYMRDPERGLLRTVLSAPGTVWGSTLDKGMSGQEPSIRALGNGSIIIGTQNFAVGRDRWEQKLTLAWRGERFVVAGFTYQYFDSLQQNPPIECDLNMLTGKGTVNGRPANFKAQSLSLTEWDAGDDYSAGLTVCQGQ